MDKLLEEMFKSERWEKAIEVRKIYYEKHKEELKEKAKLRYKRRVSKVKGDLYDL